MVAIRPAEDLAGAADPAWPVWLELAASAGVRVVMLPVSRDDGLEVLFRLQVTARSMLGALALGSGGLLVDHGWIRVLGGGSEFLPDLASVNRLGVPAEDASPPPWLTVAFDVLGGRFAVNGGGLPGQPGDGLAALYQDLRWPGWQDEVAALRPDQGIAVYPFLCTAESRPVARARRRPVPFAELLALHVTSNGRRASCGRRPGPAARPPAVRTPSPGKASRGRRQADDPARTRRSALNGLLPSALGAPGRAGMPRSGGGDGRCRRAGYADIVRRRELRGAGAAAG